MRFAQASTAAAARTASWGTIARKSSRRSGSSACAGRASRRTAQRHALSRTRLGFYRLRLAFWTRICWGWSSLRSRVRKNDFFCAAILYHLMQYKPNIYQDKLGTRDIGEVVLKDMFLKAVIR